MSEPILWIGLGGGLMAVIVRQARRNFDSSKQVMDMVLGLIAMVAAAPVLAICVLIIKLASRGPVLFRQVRVGQGGKLFTMYKLRTMHLDAERGCGATWARAGDPRVIPACRWMRRSHVDELPQLFNVLKGDMSLVGPRPERPEILDELEKHYPNVRCRLEVRPGITGLAQLRNGYDTSIQNFRHKLKADLEYIRSRRWSLELWILAATFSRFNDRAAR